MSEETKMIMDELKQMNKTMLEMKSDISELKTDMKTVKEQITNLEDGQRELHLLIENEVSKKINIVGEGHFFVMKNLKELRGFQEEKEIVIIVADAEKKLSIMQAIGETCGMHSEAKGLVVSLPIESVCGLGEFS